MKTEPAFFGYGSLVNVGTHNYANPVQASLSGWRRIWRTTTFREAAFLSVERDPSSQIDGLIARVPGSDWSDLDAREAAYTRIDVTTALATPHPTAIYRVHPDLVDTTAKGGILLSYLDVVVQGYLHAFGPDGVARFFATTSGWDLPVINDRHAPRYPRHQHLTHGERSLVDQCLAAMQDTASVPAGD